MPEKYQIMPIGSVHRFSDEDSMIEIYSEYSDGLLRIEDCKRLQILYWMHKLDNSVKSLLQAHPKRNYQRPKRGVFALRSPFRPNPLGITEVNLIKRENNKLYVSGLDALDGSPVIDIKCVS